MGLVVYREANGKALEEDYNYKADVYQIVGSDLLKLTGSFSGHWLKDLPKV